MRPQGGGGTACQPWERPQETPALPTPWSWTPASRTAETTSPLCKPICGALLGQPGHTARTVSLGHLLEDSLCGIAAARTGAAPGPAQRRPPRLARSTSSLVSPVPLPSLGTRSPERPWRHCLCLPACPSPARHGAHCPEQAVQVLAKPRHISKQREVTVLDTPRASTPSGKVGRWGQDRNEASTRDSCGRCTPHSIPRELMAPPPLGRQGRGPSEHLRCTRPASTAWRGHPRGGSMFCLRGGAQGLGKKSEVRSGTMTH